MNAEQRSVFQGIVYYYREHTVLCRYELTMKDPVDAELLQQACDEARPLAGYFFQKVVWEKREAHLAPNDAPFRVRIGQVQPRIRRTPTTISWPSAVRETRSFSTGSTSWPMAGAFPSS